MSLSLSPASFALVNMNSFFLLFLRRTSPAEHNTSDFVPCRKLDAFLIYTHVLTLTGLHFYRFPRSSSTSWRHVFIQRTVQWELSAVYPSWYTLFNRFCVQYVYKTKYRHCKLKYKLKLSYNMNSSLQIKNIKPETDFLKHTYNGICTHTHIYIHLLVCIYYLTSTSEVILCVFLKGIYFRSRLF